jgi:hypothetical protein
MKKILGFVTLLALVGASAPAIAVPPVKLDVATVAERGLAVEAFEAIATKGFTDASQLAGAQIPGITAANAGQLFLLVNPAVQALKAKKIAATGKNFDSIRTIIADSGLNAKGSMEALTNQINEHGSLDAASLSTEVAEAAGISNNVLPSVATAKSPTEFLAGYVLSTKEGQESLTSRSEDPSADELLGKAYQTAIQAAAELCEGSMTACLNTTLAGTERWGANRYHEKGAAAATFQAQAMNGFRGVENNPAPASQYWSGFGNANSAIYAARQNSETLPADLEQLNLCLATGQNSSN